MDVSGFKLESSRSEARGRRTYPAPAHQNLGQRACHVPRCVGSPGEAEAAYHSPLSGQRRTSDAAATRVRPPTGAVQSLSEGPDDVLTVDKLTDYMGTCGRCVTSQHGGSRVPPGRPVRSHSSEGNHRSRDGARRGHGRDVRMRAEFVNHPPQSVAGAVEHAKHLYHRLVLVVGDGGTGKSSALREFSARTGTPLINVGVELSRDLLELTEELRPIRATPLLDRIVAETESDVVLVDNIEVLFDVALRLDPLRVLRNLSRRRTVVAAWNGAMEQGHIVYAMPGHPEYRRYPVDGVLVVESETSV